MLFNFYPFWGVSPPSAPPLSSKWVRVRVPAFVGACLHFERVCVSAKLLRYFHLVTGPGNGNPA